MNQSEILTIICNLLNEQQTSCARGVPFFWFCFSMVETLVQEF